MDKIIEGFSYIVVVFGVIHLIRLSLYSIGSSLYSISYRKGNRIFEEPTISIVVPAHNEEKNIARCIESIIHTDYPRNKREIIIADDGSTDRTRGIALRYKEKYGEENIKVISRENSGKAVALNRALSSVESELVMCLDADSYIERDSIRNAVSYFSNKKVSALSANIKIIHDNGLLNLIQRYEYVINYHVKRSLTYFNIEYIVGGIGSVFRKSCLDEVGFYDTDTITEDIDLTMKIISLGNKENLVVYGYDVVAHTEACLSMGDLFKQRFRWKYGRLQTFIKNKSLFFSSDKKYAPQLTFLYLPFIVLSEVMFFLEPLMVSFLLFLVFVYGDILTFCTALFVVTSFSISSIIAEETMGFSEKAKMLFVSPIMYLLFNFISFIEYVALIRTYSNFEGVRQSLSDGVCHWDHVARAGQPT